MELDPTVCERARLSRDTRFDGRFFIGVTSTGVYCRPVCPVQPPKARNVRFFPSAAAAAEAGFRPCLRCRPECAPGTPAWAGTSATVSRALRLIDTGALDSGSVDDLAGRLGMGPRHLRRLFLEHVGAPPLAVAQTRRLHFAKRLIDETDLPMARVAFAAGFGSIRRFNAAIRTTYGRPPSQLRPDRARRGANGCDFVLRLGYRPPLAWDALIAFLAVRATPGVESATPEAYRRTITLNGQGGTFEVRPARPARGATAHHLELRLNFPDSAALFQIVERVRRVFDLGADPREIESHFAADPRLAPLVRACPGLRVPGAWDGFELAVRAILGQQVSVKGATTLAGRLAHAFGQPLPHGNGTGVHLLFPTPAALAEGDLASIGLPATRAEAIRGLAAAVCRGEVTFDPTVARDTLVDQLTALRGIGAWTAEYVAMRALGDPDAFPETDLGLLRAAGPPDKPLAPTRLAAEAEVWRPWRAYAAMYLWRGYAATRPKAGDARARTARPRTRGPQP